MHNLGNIWPICLPKSTDPDHVGDSVLLTGWGSISSSKYKLLIMNKSTNIIICFDFKSW